MYASSVKALGFSLLEVIIALAVAAILASSLLSMQNQSARYMEMSRDSLRCLDLTQDILAARFPKDIQASPSFIRWSEEVEGEWRIETSRSGGADTIMLDVRTGGYSMSWSWSRIAPPVAR